MKASSKLLLAACLAVLPGCAGVQPTITPPARVAVAPAVAPAPPKGVDDLTPEQKRIAAKNFAAQMKDLEWRNSRTVEGAKRKAAVAAAREDTSQDAVRDRDDTEIAAKIRAAPTRQICSVVQLAFQAPEYVEQWLGPPKTTRQINVDPFAFDGELNGGEARTYNLDRGWLIEVDYVNRRALWFTLDLSNPAMSDNSAMRLLGLDSNSLQVTDANHFFTAWTAPGIGIREARANLDKDTGMCGGAFVHFRR